MNIQNLIPIDQPTPAEQDTKRSLVNVILAIHEAIQTEGTSLAYDWAEQAGYPDPNAFMLDKAKEILAQSLAGYVEQMQPGANQFTDAHSSAYLGIEPSGDKS